MAKHFAKKADGTQCDLLTALKSKFLLIVVWGALKHAQEARNSAPVPMPRTRTQGTSVPEGVHVPRKCDAWTMRRENSLEFPLVMAEYSPNPKVTAKQLTAALEDRQ